MDSEKGGVYDAHTTSIDEKRYESPNGSPKAEIYNDTLIHQDHGFISKLRNFEARMDQKLGVESEAITRKRAEDKGPVPWHEQLTMALLWASGTMNTSCFATG